MNVLVVVDMQNDFIDGALGTEEAVTILPAVMARIMTFDGLVVATQDTHENNYLDTQEGKKLPIVHCQRDSWGWQIRDEIQELLPMAPFEKPTFGSELLASVLKEYHQEKEAIDSITLIGLCTDICVISNAMILKAFLPEVPILVDAACCAGVTPESHKQALEAMKACQIDILHES